MIQNSETAASLFEWADGVLVNAMNDGGFLLIDEISLADDAVLERLNSVLEPERKLLVSERTTAGDALEIIALEGFQLVATMNPGGDYGKKEVSHCASVARCCIHVPFSFFQCLVLHLL